MEDSVWVVAYNTICSMPTLPMISVWQTSVMIPSTHPIMEDYYSTLVLTSKVLSDIFRNFAADFNIGKFSIGKVTINI